MAGLLSVPATARRTTGSRAARGAEGAGRARGRRTSRGGKAEKERGPGGDFVEPARAPVRRSPGWCPGGGGRRPRARCGERGRGCGPGRGPARTRARGVGAGALFVRFRRSSPEPRPGCPRVLLVCGRAPGRALWPGLGGSACMGAAWVGPSHWKRRAGGTPSPHSPQAADRSGGWTTPPGPCVEPVRRGSPERGRRSTSGARVRSATGSGRVCRSPPTARNKECIQ